MSSAERLKDYSKPCVLGFTNSPATSQKESNLSRQISQNNITPHNGTKRKFLFKRYCGVVRAIPRIAPSRNSYVRLISSFAHITNLRYMHCHNLHQPALRVLILVLIMDIIPVYSAP